MILVEFHNRTPLALADDFKDIATNRLEALRKYSKNIKRIRVDILDGTSHKVKSQSHEVSIQIQTSKNIYKAHGSGLNNLSAFDQAFESIESQLRKAHSKFSTSKSRKPGLRNFSTASDEQAPKKEED